MAGGGLRTAQDYLRAAYLMQHGPDKDDPRIAHAMASLSWELDPHNKEARWLMAASWDRLMMSMGRPQWYGTQFDKPSEKFPWTLGAVDPRVTDAERATFFVPPLAESRKQLKRLNHASELLRK